MATKKVTKTKKPLKKKPVKKDDTTAIPNENTATVETEPGEGQPPTPPGVPK